MLECTRDGKDVYTIGRPNNDVLTAQKLRNNEIVVISSQGMVQRLDKDGKELKSFRMAQNTWMVGNDVLPNGNVVIAFQAPMNKVVEYDADGKAVWESSAVMNPMAAARSPNGNTLIVSQQWPNKIVEVDKSNKQVGRDELADLHHARPPPVTETGRAAVRPAPVFGEKGPVGLMGLIRLIGSPLPGCRGAEEESRPPLAL